MDDELVDDEKIFQQDKSALRASVTCLLFAIGDRRKGPAKKKNVSRLLNDKQTWMTG